MTSGAMVEGLVRAKSVFHELLNANNYDTEFHLHSSPQYVIIIIYEVTIPVSSYMGSIKDGHVTN